MKRSLLALLLFGLFGAGVLAGDEIQVVALAKDGQVHVSFRLLNAFTEELWAAIHSGLPTTITYQVDLRRQAFPFDRTVASATVTASAQYDNLTRHHTLTRKVDGRGEEPRVTEDESGVQAWMTEFERLPLFSTDGLEANGEYYVRVRARTRPRTSWLFFWPWDRGASSGSARFTFVE
jgi:hypothetical protein